MNKETTITVAKSIIIILILLAVVFALRAPAADLNILPNEIKGDYVDSSGLPYFSEMDSYYNLRLTENYVDHGYVGDIKYDNGTQMDMHRYAPDGNVINYELGIVYVTSFIHDIVNQFFGHHGIREVAFWTGAFIASLAVIPAFIFARRLTNDWGAIAATLIIVLAPNYFAHTFPGFFDTDMFYYIFSLFFIFFFVECIRTDNLALKVIYAVLSIVSIGLFSQSWTGYIFYVGLMGIFAVVYLIACYIFNIGEDNQDQYSNKLSWFIHQKELQSIILLLVIGAIGLAIFRGVDTVIGIFGSLLNLLSLQSTARVVGGFPNVLISVAEMQMPNLLGAGMGSAFLANSNGVVNGLGGISVMFAGLIVLYILVSRAFKLRKSNAPKDIKSKPSKGNRVSAAQKIDDQNKFKLSIGQLDNLGSTSDEISQNKRLIILYSCLFLVWTLITILAVTRGSRFITTIVLPFGLMTGIFIGFATDYIKNKLNNDNWLTVIVILCAALAAYPLTQINLTYGLVLLVAFMAIGLVSIHVLKPNKSADNTSIPVKKYIAIALIVLALVSPTVCGAYITANQVVPGTNDAMWNSMTWINQNTENNTVITSWWDFGYLFEVAADRQVTFDGGSQTGDRAFWLGKAMMTDDLELSAGIFRMLDTTGNRAVNKLIEITDSPGKSVDILLDVLPRTSGDAQNVLKTKYHLTDDQAKEIVGYTHPKDPRPVIFVASSDMLAKAGWWSYFGSWNFDNQTSENYNYVMPYDTVKVEPNSKGSLTLQEQGGMTVNAIIERGSGNNTTTGHVESVYTENGEPLKINDTEYNPYKASRILVIEDGYLMKNESIKDADDGNFTLMLMGQNNVYTPILIQKELENSMFTKLYLLGGSNQTIFEPVHSENGVMLFNVNFNNTKAGK